MPDAHLDQFTSAFFILAHMQHPHGYHTELAKDLSRAILRSSVFASAAMVHAALAFLSIRLNHF